MSSPTRTGALGSSAVTACVSGISVLLTATAITSVLTDTRWFLPALLSVAGIVMTGVVARTLRWWTPLVLLVQFGALLLLLSMVFTRSAALGILPGPSALRELSGQLAGALDVVRNGMPPVPADPPMQCFVALGLGAIALLVEVIVIVARTPAVAGLLLLCMFAVPASLASALLPWWSFAAGASGFALLLLSGGHHTWQDRGESIRSAVLGPHAAAVAGTAVVIALLAGVAFTGVGTEGRLPGSGTAGFGAATQEAGLRPFTSLQGQLVREQPVELFRVRGLPKDTYLRAMTLQKFNPERGWELAGLTRGVDTRRPLPLPEGTDIARGQEARIEIEPVGYRDPWLPMFGTPTSVSGMGPDWRYDPAAGVVYTQKRQESRPYVEHVRFPDPTSQELRTTEGPLAIDPAYLDTIGVKPEIRELAHRLTTHAPTELDKAVALNRFFTDPAHGFTYDLRTAPETGGDALSNFLFRDKRGFCEQYASSMAVLLRSVGIPSRVAVGFTSGHRDGDERVITTNDAHAWVEAYFPHWGWITFDPTPLNDGRGNIPAYLQQSPSPAQAPPSPAHPEPAPASQPEPQVPEGTNSGTPEPSQRETAGNGRGLWPVLALSALMLGLLMVPYSAREIRRKARLRAVTRGTTDAAGAAWREILAEFRDRGSASNASETLREVARRLASRHGLDEANTAALHTLVQAVEREWYGRPEQAKNPAVEKSLYTALDGLRHAAPLSWRDRLFPRSILTRGERS